MHNVHHGAREVDGRVHDGSNGQALLLYPFPVRQLAPRYIAVPKARVSEPSVSSVAEDDILGRHDALARDVPVNLGDDNLAPERRRALDKLASALGVASLVREVDLLPHLLRHVVGHKVHGQVKELCETDRK